jgi:hypothetical protein
VELQSLANQNASEYAANVRDHFAKKADHNKTESLVGFGIAVVSTAAISGFIALGDSYLLSKVIPLTLSLLSTSTVTWLHFRRPHQLWAIYRSAQRYIESHQVKHRFKVGEYRDTEDRDGLLAANVAKLALAAHELWVPLVPSPEGLERIATASQSPVGTPDAGSGASGEAMAFPVGNAGTHAG